MKKVIRNIILVTVLLAVFFFVLPVLNKEGATEDTVKSLELYGHKLVNPITDNQHIALFGEVMKFPLTVEELTAGFHIKDMYYDDMTDGIEPGDTFHCDLLNADNEAVAYMKVTNLKKNTAQSPDGMTITYLVVSSFQHDGEEYGVPFEITDGIGIGSAYAEVKKVFPDIAIDENEDYSITTAKLGIWTITFEFAKQKVYKMSLESY